MSNDITTTMEKINQGENFSTPTIMEKLNIKTFNEAVLKLKNGDIFTILFVEPDKFFEFEKKVEKAERSDLLSADGGFGTIVVGTVRNRAKMVEIEEREVMSASFLKSELGSLIWKKKLIEIIK